FKHPKSPIHHGTSLAVITVHDAAKIVDRVEAAHDDFGKLSKVLSGSEHYSSSKPESTLCLRKGRSILCDYWADIIERKVIYLSRGVPFSKQHLRKQSRDLPRASLLPLSEPRLHDCKKIRPPIFERNMRPTVLDIK